MIKKLLILSLIFISNATNAQEKTWAIGVDFNPFFLGTINSEKEGNVKSEGLSGGYNAGMSIKYFFLNSWNIDGGIQFSEQIYNGKELSAVQEGSNYRVNLKHFKFPLLVNYHWNLDYKNDWKVSIGLGGQLLQLNDHYLKIEDRLQIITLENGIRTLYIKEDDRVASVIENNYFSDSRLGLVGQFGLENKISSSFSYSIKLRTEYDLNIIDNDESYYDLSYFRIGLQFGLQYHFKRAKSSHIEGIL